MDEQNQINNICIRNTGEPYFINRAGFPGKWDCDKYGFLEINPDGTGTYGYKGGSIKGRWTEEVFKGTWTQNNSSGEFRFTLSKDGDSFNGKWKVGSSSSNPWHSDWNGNRVKK